MDNQLQNAIKLAQAGKFSEAKSLLEELLKDSPDNTEILYNLGMCYTELGNPDRAIETLKKGLNNATGLANLNVALGFAYSKKDMVDEAINQFEEALKIEPENSYALRNLGGLLAKKGDFDESVDLLINSLIKHPDDMRTTYGLGLAYFHTKQLQEADIQFKTVIKNSDESVLIEQAKDFRRKIAELNLKSDGFRMDAMFYCLGALNYFNGKTVQEIQKVAFEIGIKGQSGLDVNNPDTKYTLNTMKGEFTGLQLVCYMFVGFKSFAPEQDVGMDFSEEYRMAQEFYKE